jgi:disulfide oxidoreductase YuzD
MATDNRGVMVYLPLEVETKIVEYCTEYNITRKDKQGNTVTSLGSGIVAYLKSQLLSDTPRLASDRPANGLTRSEVLDLIVESSTSNTPIDRLPNPLDPAIVHRLETIEQRLSSSPAISRDEVGQLIQASEQRVMEAVRSLQDELTVDEQVNIPPIEISTTNQEKAIEDTVKSIATKGKKNSVASDLKPMSKEIRRWLKPLQDKKFKEIIQAGISNKYSNQEIVSRLFDVGYGKNDNTKPYPANLASAMKTALSS